MANRADLKLSALVVDDSPTMRALVAGALSQVQNLAVTEAGDGMDALKKLAGRRFDLIVTDINMPILDGLKLIHRVRTDPTHQAVPIVVITTERADEDRQKALSLGANAYLTKPVRADEVLATARSLLGLDA